MILIGHKIKVIKLVKPGEENLIGKTGYVTRRFGRPNVKRYLVDIDGVEKSFYAGEIVRIHEN